MTALVWDQVGERIYETGVDRGVLYLHGQPGVAWNGLIDIEESTVSELKVFHLDGVKYLENLTPGDFSGKLSAFTYPDEFESVSGVGVVGTLPGMDIYDQPAKSFNLSYRTKIGNDVEGTEYGYKIHILYNVLANPDGYGFSTLGSSVEAVEFGWSLSGTPEKLSGFRPTVHISIDSRETPSEVMQLLESMLYGTATTPPNLPPLKEIAEFFGYLGALLIIDLGNGTWSAIDEADTYITMIDSTTFEIDNVDGTYLDADTYTVSSTNIS